jgi:hypothetical protein
LENLNAKCVLPRIRTGTSYLQIIALDELSDKMD